MLRFIILLWFVFFSQTMRADHLQGGQLYLDCIDESTNTYKINLAIYKGFITTETEPWIQILKSDGSLFSALQLNIINIYDHNYLTEDELPMLRCDSFYDANLQDSFYYNSIITLDSFPVGGLTFVYQKCCSGFPFNFEPSGMTLFLKVYFSNCNSTPRAFHPNLNRVNCWHEYFDKNFAGIDIDGDSLTYELIPIITGAEAPPLEIIPPMLPDPFIYVNFIPPYSLANYIGGLVPMVITPEGHLVGEASVYGGFMVNILVKEYRYGVLLSEMNNEFTMLSIPCFHPYIALLNDTLLCNNTSVQLDNIISTTATAFAPHNYLWDFGVAGSTTDTSTDSSPTFTYPAPGSYNVMMVDGVGDECADTAFATVVVSEPVTAAFASISGCVGDTLTLFATSTSSTAISTWQWAGTGVSSSINPTSQNPYFVFASATPIITPTATNALGCSGFYTDTLQLLLRAPTSVSLDTTVCLGATLTLQADGGGTYSWSANAQTSASTASIITITPTLSANFNVAITDANGCQTMHFEQVVVDVISGFHAEIGNDTLVTAGLHINIIAPVGVTFEWLPTGETTPSISYAATDNSQVILIATDDAGCKSYDTLTVRIKAANIALPNAFSPDGDNINDVFQPFYSGIASLDFLRIYNRWGEVVFETNNLNQAWNGTYKGEPQPLSTYIVQTQGSSYSGQTVTANGNVTLVR